MQENLINRISEEKIYPIIRSSNAEDAIKTAKALVDGGIKILEINIENNSLYEAVGEVSKFADVVAGGIITAQQAFAAINSGAKVLSSPVFQMNMVKISKDKQIPLIACVSTPNEAYEAWRTRIPLLKVFPAKAMGGTLYIEDLLRPMPFLNILASGNIKLNEVTDYLKSGATAVGVGRSFYKDSTYEEITQKAKDVIKAIKEM